MNKPWAVVCPACRKDILLCDQDWSDDFVTEGEHDFTCPHCDYCGRIDVTATFHHEFILNEEDEGEEDI